jgi:hypothetical protein
MMFLLEEPVALGAHVYKSLVKYSWLERQRSRESISIGENAAL